MIEELKKQFFKKNQKLFIIRNISVFNNIRNNNLQVFKPKRKETKDAKTLFLQIIMFWIRFRYIIRRIKTLFKEIHITENLNLIDTCNICYKIYNNR